MGSAPGYEERLLWAAAAVCFFGFFSTGEITASSASAFDPSWHLAWGDVSISGATRDELCQIQAVRSYVAVRGESPGAFFRSLDGCPLSKARFVDLVRSTLARAGVYTHLRVFRA